MACETETKQIGDHEYGVTQWPATKSILMKLKLIKTFGATIALIASSVGESDSKKDTSKDEAKALSEGLTILFNSNSPEEMTNLMKQCVVGVSCNGTIITDSSFDTLFSGDSLLEVYKVFMFVIKVNYSNLMKGQLAEKLLARLPTEQ